MEGMPMEGIHHEQHLSICFEIWASVQAQRFAHLRILSGTTKSHAARNDFPSVVENALEMRTRQLKTWCPSSGELQMLFTYFHRPLFIGELAI